MSIRNIKDIALFEQKDDSFEEKKRKHKTSVFIASIYSLYYADIDVRKLDGIAAICLSYHDVINSFKFTENYDECSERLRMIQSICAVPKMHGLYGSYKNPVEAIRIACGNINNLIHDYYIVTPRSYATGELERIKQHEKKITEYDVKVGLETIGSLKELFN